jgi:hypothetical protein
MYPLPQQSIRILPLVAACVLGLAGCASTQIEYKGLTSEQPLCQKSGEQVSALVLWAPQWRANQKEPARREAAAQSGIERFFAQSGCFSSVQILRTVGDRPATDMSAPEVRALATDGASPRSRAVFITVRELGPVLKLFNSLALVEGGTDVVLDIKSTVPATGEVIAAFQSHWQHGGPWVIKGVKTLEQDIGETLRLALKPAGARP